MIEKIYTKYIQSFSFESLKCKRILKKIKKYIKSKKVLDVGCGLGGMAYEMSFYASIVDGIDINKKIIDSINRSKSNLNFYSFSIQEYGIKGYEVITSFQVLEHLKNDVDALKKMKKLLKKNGYIIFSTPNSDTLKKYNFKITKKIKKLPFNLKKFFGELTKDMPHGHVRIGYNKQDFEKISSMLNMKIVEIFYEKTPIILYEIYFLLPSIIRVILSPFFSLSDILLSKINETEGISIYVVLKK